MGRRLTGDLGYASRGHGRLRDAEEHESLDRLDYLGEEEEECEVIERRQFLAPAMKMLDERNRLILHLRFFEGMTQTQIATRVGISQMHVSRLIRKSIEALRNNMRDEQESVAQDR